MRNSESASSGSCTSNSRERLLPRPRDQSPFHEHTSPRWLLQDSECNRDDKADASLRLWDLSTHREKPSDLSGEMVLPMVRSSIARDESTRSRHRRVGFDFSPEAKVRHLPITTPPHSSQSRTGTKRPFACMPFNPKAMKNLQNGRTLKSNAESSPLREEETLKETYMSASSRHSVRSSRDDINKSPCLKRSSFFTNSSHILPPPPQFGSGTVLVDGGSRSRRSIHEKYGVPLQSPHKSDNSNNAPGGCGVRSTFPKHNSSIKDTCKQPVLSRPGCSSHLKFPLSEAVPVNIKKSRSTRDDSAKRDENTYFTPPHHVTSELQHVLRHYLHLDKLTESERKRLRRTHHTTPDLRLSRAATIEQKMNKNLFESFRPHSDTTLRTHLSPSRPVTTRRPGGHKCDVRGTDHLLGDLTRRTKTVTPTTPPATKYKFSASEIRFHKQRHRLRDRLCEKLAQMKLNQLSETGGYPKRHTSIENTRRLHTPKRRVFDLKTNSVSEGIIRHPTNCMDKLSVIEEWLKKKRSVPKMVKSTSDLESFTHRSRYQDRFKSGTAVRVWRFPKNTHLAESKNGNNKFSIRNSGCLLRINPYENSEDPIKEQCCDLLNAPAYNRMNSPRNELHLKSTFDLNPRSSQKKIQSHNRFRSNSFTHHWQSLKTPRNSRLIFDNIPSTSISQARNTCLTISNPNISETHLLFEKYQQNNRNTPSKWESPNYNLTLSDLRPVLKNSYSVRTSSVTQNVPLAPTDDTVSYDPRISLNPSSENLNEITHSVASYYEPRNWVPCTDTGITTNDLQNSTSCHPHVFERTMKQNSLSGKTIVQSAKKYSTSAIPGFEILENKKPKSRNRSLCNKSIQNQAPKSRNGKKLPVKRVNVNFDLKKYPSVVDTRVNCTQSKIRCAGTVGIRAISPKRCDTLYIQGRNISKMKQMQDAIFKSSKTKRNGYNIPKTPEECSKSFLALHMKKDSTKQRRKVVKNRTDGKSKGKEHRSHRSKEFVKLQRRKLKVQVPQPTELLQISRESIDSHNSIDRMCDLIKSKVSVDMAKEYVPEITEE